MSARDTAHKSLNGRWIAIISPTMEYFHCEKVKLIGRPHLMVKLQMVIMIKHNGRITTHTRQYAYQSMYV